MSRLSTSTKKKNPPQKQAPPSQILEDYEFARTRLRTLAASSNEQVAVRAAEALSRLVKKALPATMNDPEVTPMGTDDLIQLFKEVAGSLLDEGVNVGQLALAIQQSHNTKGRNAKWQ